MRVTPDVVEQLLGKNVCAVHLCLGDECTTRKEASKAKGATFIRIVVPQTPLLCSRTRVAKFKAGYFVLWHVGRFCGGLSPWRVIHFRHDDSLGTNGAHEPSARAKFLGVVD